MAAPMLKAKGTSRLSSATSASRGTCSTCRQRMRLWQLLAEYAKMAEIQTQWEERILAVDGVTGIGLGLEDEAPVYIAFADRQT